MRGTNREHHDFYKRHITEQLLPFWNKAVDPARGGVFTGFDASGEKLLHRDKFTWSQGRFLWVWSRVGELCRSGRLDDDPAPYLDQAERTYSFLEKHVFLPDGSCRFLLTEEGAAKEMVPGEGHDISFYADCFVVMGFAEFARTTQNAEALNRAARLFDRVRERLADGTARSEPYPIPAGCKAHGYAMILLNTAQVLALAAEQAGRSELACVCRAVAKENAEEIVYGFKDDRNRIREVREAREIRDFTEADAAHPPEALLLRHLNPGHSVESLWFVMEEARRLDDRPMLDACITALKQTLRMGWDRQNGGLLRYVDLEGGPPKGTAYPGAERFERLIRDTWDTKLWWPHSEGLYACRLAYELTGDTELLDWYDRLSDYTFSVFPLEPGQEWGQIRDKRGELICQVVALPVKDPYHILRNMILLLDLTEPGRAISVPDPKEE